MGPPSRVRPRPAGDAGDPVSRAGVGASALRQSGFTLLEVLIAVAVLGMLIGLLDQGLGFAMRVAAMQGRTGAAIDVPIADATLRRLIAAADPGVYPEPASLKGTGAAVTMVTQVPGADGVRRPVDATVFAAGGALQVRSSPHRHVDPAAPASRAETTVLLAGVEALAIDYADGRTGAWHATWTAETLPALVRVRLTMADHARHWPPIIVATRLEAPGQ